MKEKIRKLIDATLDENPGLVRPDCEYKRIYDTGNETLTLYALIDNTLREGKESICELDVSSDYCEKCVNNKVLIDSL